MVNSSGIKLFRHEINFIAGAMHISQVPKLHLPQIAFVGKSNVGKSSLINSLCNRKKLARISSNPGHTRQINFFSLAKKFILTDLPGYGFAKVSHKERNNWQNLILSYFRLYQSMIFVNLLIDARRNLQEKDIEIMHLLSDLAIPYQLVLTKIDKEKVDETYLTIIKSELLKLQLQDINIIPTSSKNNYGIKELQKSIIEKI